MMSWVRVAPVVVILAVSSASSASSPHHLVLMGRIVAAEMPIVTSIHCLPSRRHRRVSHGVHLRKRRLI